MSSTLPQIGVHPTATDRSMPVLELAREAESRGFRSLYFPEHTHVPVDSMQITPEWRMDARYQRAVDPYIASAFVAATTSLEVGTGISLVAQHDAIALAKQIATLEHLAPGRVVLGVGYGYNRQEAEDHGVPFERRVLVVEETVRLMRALWTEDEAAFEGRFRRLSPSWSWPKPSAGGPPVLLGARATPRNFTKIVDWADGWIPMGQGATNVEPALAELRGRWADAGRAAQLQVCCWFQPNSRAQLAAEFARAAELGIQRMQLYLEDRTRDEALPLLDDVMSVLEELG
jgi:probable F420-dependent oxidoreductase